MRDEGTRREVWSSRTPGAVSDGHGPVWLRSLRGPSAEPLRVLEHRVGSTDRLRDADGAAALVDCWRRPVVGRRPAVESGVRHASESAVSAQAAGSLGPARQTARLRELAAVFLRLGLTAFGGPAAHIAMMEDEAVVRRQWLTRERFLDLLAVANLLPGPTSSEVAIYLGYVRAGWPGLLIGGACFVVPAALLVAALAWTYTRFGSLPE